MADKTVPVSAYFDPVLFQKLESVAKAEDRSISYVIVQAVREWIAKHENVPKSSTNSFNSRESRGAGGKREAPKSSRK